MWKCPVCDQENAATVCPTCGYDRTCDYERYPTAFAVTAAKPTHTLRRQWQAKQEPTTKPQPRPTVAQAAAPVRKRSGLRAVIIAIAVAAIVLAFFLVNQKKSANSAPVSYKTYERETDMGVVRCVKITLGVGVIDDTTIKEAQELLSKYSCSDLYIVGGVADSSSMKRIRELNGIEQLTFKYCEKVTDLDQFSNMRSLTSVRMSNISDLDLTGIEKITALSSLYVVCCESADLQKLKNATQLRELKFVRSKVESLSGLENLTNLTRLDLRHNQISDLRPLSNLTDLWDLSVTNNQITSLAGLENLTNLLNISAYGNPLTDTSALEVSGCMDALHMDSIFGKMGMP